MSELVYAVPVSTTCVKALSVAILKLTQTGEVEGGEVSEVSLWMGTGLYNGTYPDTVELSLTSSAIGAHRVHRITELGKGSPDATPWVKFNCDAL